ncbi:TatD family hydrolase [Caminibacter pacificus]|uniref:TatD DNase family protein n=1 Tax=Caminibacter pacificus TaxID=1424653 RepID=A0AAJ4RED5_9BACT|nr:TatD family hydrolase [Caminibacter pacificus]QCI28232.1 TatD family deoxyribonuclease [Caminibacter pacificus]ROR41054.1 TatD DNase family protein [Caminibacter pacificus]
MIIDTHTHLDNEKFIDDVDEVIRRAKDAGVEKFIIPAADPKDLPRAIELAQNYEDVYFAVGFHPVDIDKYDEKLITCFITHPKCVAVGEIGLDYHWVKEPEKRQKQIELFHRQIEIAKEYNKPIIVHIRDATEDSVKVIEAHPDIKGVFHCYNAAHHLLKFSDRFYYGIGGVITFKNARKLLEVFPKIPKDRVIIETDAPYLTPHPHRGKRNEPYYTIYIRDKIAELWGVTPQEVEEITTQNAKRLFKI